MKVGSFYWKILLFLQSLFLFCPGETSGANGVQGTRKGRVCSDRPVTCIHWVLAHPSAGQMTVTHSEACLFLIKLTLDHDGKPWVSLFESTC